jgi:hypothetical protein
VASGPKKTATVELRGLGEQIRSLSHRAKRTGGTGSLYAKVKGRKIVKQLPGNTSDWGALSL